ncbi:ribosome biogenesis GTP-binding protein YihA/YsxC [Ferrimonas aestuarii]|uniref:Probable GTP-binding protein EngB n=1 Tax=Ferrimonas aestuarii TaxID=2569539 RepID=A0A4U1BQD8_9GAMM|nr:ribosome biogenesis GTP-binding protein YihA/YsxC [Ferrimonas aestuarii]TKB56190.1 YihA family ribosome biogenesis GTP-binding protein [Ferrimonas aestuarii]
MTDTQIDFRRAKYLTSAPDISFLPADVGVEVAFAGRSNAGKSSALNTMTDQKGLARTSKTPGRTQMINLFEVAEGRRLVDLPGYGFAQVPLEMKKKWQKALAEYLEKRQCLQGLVVLMDCRHPLKDLDVNMIRWGIAADLPVLVLLTKADKLKQNVKQKTLRDVKAEVKDFGGDITVQLFSSLKGTGRGEAIRIISGWLTAEDELELEAE